MMDVLNSMSTIASSTAKSAVNGTQYLYTNLVTKNTTSSSVTNSNVGVGATSSGGVGGGGAAGSIFGGFGLLPKIHISFYQVG